MLRVHDAKSFRGDVSEKVQVQSASPPKVLPRLSEIRALTTHVRSEAKSFSQNAPRL